MPDAWRIQGARGSLLTFALVLSGGVFAAESTPDWQLWTRSTSQSYAEPVSVYSAFHDLEGEFTRGDEAFTHNQIEVGASRGQFSLAVIARYDFNIKAHADTIELVHADQNNLPVDLDREYQLNAAFNQITSMGVRLDYQYQPSENFDLNVAVSLLQANRHYFGNIEGSIANTADNIYKGEATIDYSYSSDPLLNRRVTEPNGYGYAVDMSARWRPSQHVRVVLTAHDWAHRIYWDNAPFTRADITSATVTFDENGYIETVPLLSGIEGEHDLRQRLPARTDLDIRLLLRPGLELELGAFNVDSITLPRLGFRWNTDAGNEWFLNFSTESEAFTLGLVRNRLSFHLGLDSLDYQEAHFFAFGFKYIHPL